MDDSRLIDWVMKFNAYDRIAQTPDKLAEVLEPAWQEYRRTGLVPEWAGVDLLRGWAFLMVRTNRFTANSSIHEEFPEFLSVVEAVRNHKKAKKRDLPPVL
jgi:hypothetical protein